jgi:hypothetical protein
MLKQKKQPTEAQLLAIGMVKQIDLQVIGDATESYLQKKMLKQKLKKAPLKQIAFKEQLLLSMKQMVLMKTQEVIKKN